MKNLTNADYCDAASLLKCEVAAIMAVASVESAGAGFLPDGRAKILFERHHFSRLTNHRFDATHPDISNRNAGGYKGNAAEYARLERAQKLDPVAALMSASWGKFQIMGFNFGAAGFTKVSDFVDAMRVSERNHLLAFCHFVKTNGLVDELREKDWAGFARGYNGRNYAKNAYDTKMASAYRKYAALKIDCNQFRNLRDAEVSAAVQPKPTAAPASTPAATGQTPATETIPAVQPVSITADSRPPAISEPVVETPEMETKTVTAPVADGSTATGTKLTIAGFGVPAILVTLIQVIESLVTKGFVDARELGSLALGFVRENTKYVFILIAIIIIAMAAKKLYKQITLWLQMYFASRPDAHDVKVEPHL